MKEYPAVKLDSVLPVSGIMAGGQYESENISSYVWRGFVKLTWIVGLRSAIAKVRHSKGPPSQKARAAYGGRNLNVMGGYTRD